MERELWREVARALKRLPCRRPRGGVYSNRQVLAVLVWAGLHERSVSWACCRENWPVQAWRRELPGQPTMSRRLRDPEVEEDLRRLVAIIQRRLPPSRTLILDGKPLAVSEFTSDPEAATGWGAGRYAKGYKLHALIDGAHRLLAWAVRPMNEAECVVAVGLLARAARDGAFLLAPRRKPGGSVSSGHAQHPGRLASIALTEHDPAAAAWASRTRKTVERYFGTLASCAGGLFALPAWARRMARVVPWVGAKLVLNTARHCLRTTLDA